MIFVCLAMTYALQKCGTDDDYSADGFRGTYIFREIEVQASSSGIPSDTVSEASHTRLLSDQLLTPNPVRRVENNVALATR